MSGSAPVQCNVCLALGGRVAGITKTAETKETAIAAEAAQTADAGLGGSADDGTAVTTYSMDITRDRDGTEVKITDTAMADDDDPKFMQAMDLGGGTTMHVRAMEADDDGNVEEEVVIVSTDIAAPKATAFAMVNGQELNARDLDEAVDADEDGTNTNDYTVLTITAGTDDVNLPKIMSPVFPPPQELLLLTLSMTTTPPPMMKMKRVKSRAPTTPRRPHTGSRTGVRCSGARSRSFVPLPSRGS